MRRFLIIFCVAALLISLLSGATFASFAAGEDNTMNRDKYGLHVEADGTITLRGEPFYGFGVNYFAAFARHVESEDMTTEEFKAGLAGLASYNIPFVRLPLSGYAASYYDVYDEDAERVFGYMKAVLDECEKNHIGVIVSLMWWDAALPAHVKGKRSDMGNPESEVVKYAKKYVTDVVSRFADHPAVWGWEIGNEYNLGADLCDKECKEFLWHPYESMPLDGVNGYDYYTSEEMAVFYKEIAGVIRKYDTYRMITTGNGEMRPYSYALYQQGKEKDENHFWELRWDQNSREEFVFMNELMTPDPIDTVCFHLQHGTADGKNRYVMNFRYFGRNMSPDEYFKAYRDTAKNLGKACFFGEFGDMLDMENAPDMLDKFKEVTSAISKADIQIASLWQFQDYTDEGTAGQKLEVLSDLNKKLAAEGKQGSESVWQPPTGDEPVYVPETPVPRTPNVEDDPEDNPLKVVIPVAAGTLGACAAGGAAAAIIVHKKKKNKKQ